MADRSRLASLSLEENDQLSEVVREFPCLYDKSKKEYKDKNVVKMLGSKWQKSLTFLSDGKKNSC